MLRMNSGKQLQMFHIYCYQCRCVITNIRIILSIRIITIIIITIRIIRIIIIIIRIIIIIIIRIMIMIMMMKLVMGVIIMMTSILTRATHGLLS